MTAPSRIPEIRRAKYAAKNTVTVSVDLESLDALLDELGDAVEEAVRPAAQAAAQVLYDEVRQNVKRIGSVSGNLLDAIYQAYSKDNSGPRRATYHIGWRTGDSELINGLWGGRTYGRTAPHGHLIEYGYLQRYVAYIGKDGNWHTAIRPEKRKTKKPNRRLRKAEKIATYLPLPGGPRQIPARPFIRPAVSKFPAAIEAAKAELMRYIHEGRR